MKSISTSVCFASEYPTAPGSIPGTGRFIFFAILHLPRVVDSVMLGRSCVSAMSWNFTVGLSLLACSYIAALLDLHMMDCST